MSLRRLFFKAIAVYRQHGLKRAIRRSISFVYVHVYYRSVLASVRRYGFRRGLKRKLSLTYLRTTRSISGTNVFSKEWDVLLVLDACRRDELRRLASDYDYLRSNEISSHPTIASCTWNWIPRTFDGVSPDLLRETAYVTANPYSDSLDEELRTVDEVWRYAWDEALGTVLPRPVTDRAITVAREEQPDRLIVHYLQPHSPFLNQIDSFPEEVSHFTALEGEGMGSWGYVQRGDMPVETAIDGYHYNLRQVLDDVTLLLNNMDAERVVITADHGEAFGEYGIYGHPPNTPIEPLLQVPWVETTATDEGTYQPTFDEQTQTQQSVEDRLQALGYTQK